MKLLLLALFLLPLRGQARPEIKGGLDKGVIDEYIRRHMPQLRACYERQLTDADAVKTVRIQTHFTIDAKGQVSKATVSPGPAAGSKLEKCITGVLTKIIFPEPVGGGIVDVDYPFSFKPREKDTSK